MDKSHNEILNNSFEEIYLDHEIYIQPNRDQYRGGFEWSVCRTGVELDSGMDFTFQDALTRAKNVVNELTRPLKS